MGEQQQNSSQNGHAALLVDFRLKNIEESLQRMADQMGVLVGLQQQYIETREALARAFKTIEDHEHRLRAMENEMPTLRMTSRWVISGVIGLICLVGVMWFKILTYDTRPISSLAPVAPTVPPSRP